MHSQVSVQYGRALELLLGTASLREGQPGRGLKGERHGEGVGSRDSQ